MGEWNHAEQVKRIAADPDAAAHEMLRLLNRNVDLGNKLVDETNRCARIADQWQTFWAWEPGQAHDCTAKGNPLTYGRRQAAEVIARDIRARAKAAQTFSELAEST